MESSIQSGVAERHTVNAHQQYDSLQPSMSVSSRGYRDKRTAAW